jgi:hypothetical protein
MAVDIKKSSVIVIAPHSIVSKSPVGCVTKVA